MSIFDDLLGKTSADAAKKAAADTYNKQTAATGAITDYGNQYADQFKGLADKFDPYSSAGTDALSRLMAGLGLGGDASGFTAAYRATPGYQAGLDTGVKSATQAANAGGMLNSGATLKALDRFGSDYEDQKSGDYLNRLLGLTQLGEGATNQEVATEGQGLTGQLQTRQSAYGGDMTAAGTIGQGDVAAAQSKQSALTNLMGMGANLLGIGIGTNWGSNPTNLSSLMKNTGWATPAQRA